jgi:flap endonuclease-1
MGVQISKIVPAKEIELQDLSGKRIGIDALNHCYQFLSIIRDRFTGEPLRDSHGNITSHLSGVLYRTTNLIEAGVKPVYVFDGEVPEFKRKTVEERKMIREEARKKWEEAVSKGEEAKMYAQAAVQFTDEMIEDTKKLLEYMGIPWIEGRSEGEAQLAFMTVKGDIWSSASQDWDSILFGATRLVRNLSITGKRKLPKKEMYIEIKPELIELDKVLSGLGITQKQLIIIGILVGTDYAPGIKGVGPVTALKLVKEQSLKKILEKRKWESDVDPEEIVEFFLNPPVTDEYKLDWTQPDKKKIMKFMVDEHDFSAERVEKVIDKLQTTFSSRQASLKGFLEK